MCKECEQALGQMARTHATLVEQATHISSLCTQLKVATDGSQYEYSEPMSFGGQTGSYRIRSPFVSTNVQWHVESITSPQANMTAIVGNEVNMILPGFVAADTPTSEFSPIRGLILSATTTNPVPVNSSWYDLTDSQGVLFAIISVSGGNAGYITVQFRRKR